MPGTAHQFTIIDFADSVDGWICSQDGVFATTVDGGKHWTLDSLSIVGKIRKMKYFGKNKCWLCVDSTYFKSSFYFTTNGKEWVRRFLPDSLLHPEMAFVTEKTISLSAINGIMCSNDGGVTWQITLALKPGAIGSTISFADSSIGIVAFRHYGPGGETTNCLSLRTTNSGVTWDTLKFGTTSYLAVNFYTSKCGYILWSYVFDDAMWAQSGIMLTNDAGKSFESKQTAGLGAPPNQYECMSGIKYPNYPAFILSTDSRMKQNAEGNFTVVRLDTAAIKILMFESVSENYNWILASGNRLFQSIGVPTEANQFSEKRAPSRFTLYPNYPNPFNPTTTIPFDVSKSSHVTLAVYDCLGREIVILVNGYRDAGHYEVRFHANGLGCGVYFCRLSTNQNVATSKIVLLK